ncbi:MAG: DUF4886 domain-containing protein [Paludibacteraceae bacterium]|nr:DUF4886 domain-containing protein [Paludibacteraceae bacterium]
MVGTVSAEPVRILGIGNSFTVDALEQHMQPLLGAEGVDAVIGYPYRGGTWLSQHDAWSQRNDTLPYNYRKFKDGQFTSTGLGTYSLKMAMEDEPWDWVIIQSDHDSAGIYQSYVPYMEHLIDFVHANCSNPNVKIGFYMTWAYDEGSTYSSFKLYGKNQQTMYDSIIAAAQQVMANHPELELLIPAGTAVQNARTSYMGQRLNRDGYHLHYNHGRYIASLIWYEKIFGVSALDVTWKPESITDYCADMCRHAVHAAVETPYAVTSLADNFSEPEHETIEPGTESHLKRMTVNGQNVVLGEDTAFTVKVDYTRTPVALYAYPIDNNAELNITDAYGADIERDVTKPWYYPLVTPEKGATVTYTIRVISEAMGADETIYKLSLVGAEAADITYPIASRADMEDFAEAVNGGSYALNAEVTEDFNMDHTKQDCWKTPIGTKDHPWTGTFDGKGHTISGFNIYYVDDPTLSAYTFVGLFGYIQNASIRRLRIIGTEESYFNRPSSGTDDTQNKAFSILCGCSEAGTIQDCSVSMPIFTNVSGSVGMIVGRNADVSGAAATVIERCYVGGTWRIRHKGIYGGIMGYGYNAVIRDSYSTCTMALQQDKGARIGGVLGYVNSSSSARSLKIENCHFYGKLTPFDGATTTSYIGAIAGVFNGTSVTAVNCWYREGSAPAVFGQHNNNSQGAQSATKTQFADGTVTEALGAAWEQGTSYPTLKAPEEEPTGIESIQPSDVRSQKILRNGQLYLMYKGTMYSVQGQKIFQY